MSTPDLTRRSLLHGALGLAAGAAAAGPIGFGVGSRGAQAAETAVPAAGTRLGPLLARAARPEFTHGIQAGDVGKHTAVIWARASREARMFVQVSATGSFGAGARVRTVRGPLLTSSSDRTGKLELTGLETGHDVHYRVILADPDATGPDGAHLDGVLRTVSGSASSDIRFLWSGDQGGQQFGRNPDLGGYAIYRAMAERKPHFFLHCGDTIYSDGPITGNVRLPDGRIYRNVVTEEKSRVAQTLAQYRGCYKYNLADENLQRFFAATSQLNAWDDHEVHNNWWPHQILSDDRYTEKRIDVLAKRGYRAWREYVPIGDARPGSGRVYRKTSHGPLLDIFTIDMRSYRNRNPKGFMPGKISSARGILGKTQAEWLADALAASRATWKVVQSDMPLCLFKPDDTRVEAVAQGDPGKPLGREKQIAWLLREIGRRGIKNVVWLTADVHYTAAHHYLPSKAAFSDFEPFWEFVSGPLNAGGGDHLKLDRTFGPQEVYVHASPRRFCSPLEGYQHFGEVNIDGASRTFSVTLRDLWGKALHRQTLHPR